MKNNIQNNILSLEVENNSVVPVMHYGSVFRG